jgi:hypothetical protein
MHHTGFSLALESPNDGVGFVQILVNLIREP